MGWLLVLVACGPGGVIGAGEGSATGSTTTAPADWEPFPRDRLVEVEITLDPEDWDALRVQGISVVEELADEGCLDEPFPDPYDWFHADVVVDGIPLEDVGIRKKGFVGSLSSSRPSLKIKFGKYVEGRTLGGLERMTLNNDKQDPSHVRQCLGYGFFTEAGLPAARCALAHVTVNGEDLGIYTHVESMKQPFLDRVFEDSGGDFWEGTVSDFREGWMGTFEAKTHEGDFARLEAVQAAAEAPDEEVVAALEQEIDLDQFLRFWAAEVLAAHWDGYAGNTNNFYLYLDPSQDRFVFVPWGIDAAFAPGNPFGEGLPTAVVANGVLAWRLLGVEEGRDRYVQALRELLDGPWDEDALLSEIDRLESLALEGLAPGDDPAALAEEVDVVREVVAGRRTAVEAELDAGPPSWPLDLRDTPCLAHHGDVVAEFATTWDSLDAWNPLVEGDVDLAVTWDGEALAFEQVGAVAGDDGTGSAVIALLGLLDDGTYGLVYLGMDRERWGPGVVPLDWKEGFGALYHLDPEVDAEFSFVAYLAHGELVLDRTSEQEGGEVQGAVEAGIWGY